MLPTVRQAIKSWTIMTAIPWILCWKSMIHTHRTLFYRINSRLYPTRSLSPLSLQLNGSTDSLMRLSRAESAEIFSKKYAARSHVKSSIIEDEKTRRLQKEKRRQLNIQKWQSKLAKSPFNVNLVADNERLDEVHLYNCIDR
jgi:hypothetical protein